MKFKVGDRVKIAKTSPYYGDPYPNSTNPMNVEGTLTDCLRDKTNPNWFPLSVDWDNGQSDNYNITDLELVNTQTNNKMTTNQLMKDALKAQVDKLLKANNTVTTLEVKVELRKTDPEFYWDQATVSRMMDELAQDGTLTYTDNGTYRTYSAVNSTLPSQTTVGVSGHGVTTPTTVKTPQKITKTVGVKKISRTKALDLLKNSKGHFFTAVFVKKDNTDRTINAQYIKDQTPSVLGLVKVRETSKLKANENPIRQININTLKSLSIGGEIYKIRN